MAPLLSAARAPRASPRFLRSCTNVRHALPSAAAGWLATARPEARIAPLHRHLVAVGHQRTARARKLLGACLTKACVGQQPDFQQFEQQLRGNLAHQFRARAGILRMP